MRGSFVSRTTGMRWHVQARILVQRMIDTCDYEFFSYQQHQSPNFSSHVSLHVLICEKEDVACRRIKAVSALYT
jgi:hypothetical protein